MNQLIKLILAKRLLDKCGCAPGHSVYALISDIYGDYCSGVYSHSLQLKPELLESAFAIFHDKETTLAKSSPAFLALTKNKDTVLEIFGNSDVLLGKEEIEKLGTNEINATLSIIFSSYLDSFVKPVQFYLPISSSCAGQWKLWEQLDYFAFLQNNKDMKKQFLFRERLAKHPVWKMELKPEDFTLAIRKAIAKRGMFGKKLEPEAMIKAIIIRMGEISSPAVSYETIDYSMRSMFTYLKCDKYLRVDREIEFLKRLEEAIKEEILFCFK